MKGILDSKFLKKDKDGKNKMCKLERNNGKENEKALEMSLPWEREREREREREKERERDMIAHGRQTRENRH